MTLKIIYLIYLYIINYTYYTCTIDFCAPYLSLSFFTCITFTFISYFYTTYIQ